MGSSSLYLKLGVVGIADEGIVVGGFVVGCIAVEDIAVECIAVEDIVAGRSVVEVVVEMQF